MMGGNLSDTVPSVYRYKLYLVSRQEGLELEGEEGGRGLFQLKTSGQAKLGQFWPLGATFDQLLCSLISALCPPYLTDAVESGPAGFTTCPIILFPVIFTKI